MLGLLAVEGLLGIEGHIGLTDGLLRHLHTIASSHGLEHTCINLVELLQVAGHLVGLLTDSERIILTAFVEGSDVIEALVDLLDGAELCADALELYLVDGVETLHVAVERSHLLGIGCCGFEGSHGLLQFAEGSADLVELLHILLGGFGHLVGLFWSYTHIARSNERCCPTYGCGSACCRRTSSYDDGSACRHTTADDGDVASDIACAGFSATTTWLGTTILHTVEAIACSLLLIGDVEFGIHLLPLIVACWRVESREEEDDSFGAHTDDEHKVGAGNMGQLEECAKDDDGGTDGVEVVESFLSLLAFEDLENMKDITEVHIVLLLFCFF